MANTGKLLFSSFLLEGREIFDVCRRALAMARLTISVEQIYLLSFTENSHFFVCWVLFGYPNVAVTLKLFVLRGFLWDFTENPKG